ncbi:hypothetical protein VNO78_10328 [Psophocarpus tetragonolobus]|uniref:Uncharacterized protein n=1 Tax=Psophocarpus tetragonolobus TaxID=3891 RepID=A0AAN9SL44_PSOTE
MMVNVGHVSPDAGPTFASSVSAKILLFVPRPSIWIMARIGFLTAWDPSALAKRENESLASGRATVVTFAYKNW